VESVEEDRNQEERARSILGRLAGDGRRLTSPRQAIVRSVVPRHDTFSAQDIVDELKAGGVRVGRATVFRTIDLLAEEGLLHRIQAGDGSHRYTACNDAEHHHHARCVACGTVSTIHAPQIDAEIQRLAEREGFEMVDHIVELIGRCQACR